MFILRCSALSILDCLAPVVSWLLDINSILCYSVSVNSMYCSTSIEFFVARHLLDLSHLAPVGFLCCSALVDFCIARHMNIFVTQHIQLSGLIDINYLPIFLGSYRIFYHSASMIFSAPFVVYSALSVVYSALSVVRHLLEF